MAVGDRRDRHCRACPASTLDPRRQYHLDLSTVNCQTDAQPPSSMRETLRQSHRLGHMTRQASGRRSSLRSSTRSTRRSARFIVSNPTVWRLHGEALADLTREEPILLPDGERFKNLPTVGRIYDALIRASADRATTIVAIGGGVVGDIAGFAAATFLRGVPGRPGADDAAGAGGQRDRRQGRRQSCRGQEPDRRLPSARGRHHRSGAARRRCRGASSAPASTRS